jgi:hypothetical protein
MDNRIMSLVSDRYLVLNRDNLKTSLGRNWAISQYTFLAVILTIEPVIG